MKRMLLFVAAAGFSSGILAATYTYTGSPFTQFENFSLPCAAGPCANFPAGSMLRGWFTTASPLPAFQPSFDIHASVTGFSFTDGINTYTSADPNTRIHTFDVSTDAGGNIASAQIQLSAWKSGSSPHVISDRVSYMTVSSAFATDQAFHDYRCASVGAADSPDLCLGAQLDSSASNASGPYGNWFSQLVPVAGLWWNPLESGSGYNLDVKHGVLVMTVFSYRPTGEQEWYITSGPIVNGSFTGTLNRYVGGQCISCPYNGLPNAAGNAGVVTISFTSPVSATMFLPGGRVTNIEPQAF